MTFVTTVKCDGHWTRNTFSRRLTFDGNGCKMVDMDFFSGLHNHVNDLFSLSEFDLFGLISLISQNVEDPFNDLII